MIACYQLTVSHPSDRGFLFEDGSFEVQRGEWAEVVGPAGSGKSVLYSMAALERRPLEGRIVVGGRDLERVGAGDLAEMRRSMGCCGQPPEFLEERSVLENVTAPLVVRGESADARKRGEELLERAGLAGRSESPVGELAESERRLLGVLRAVVGEPDLVLVDGALEFLSGAHREEAAARLTEAHGRGATVVAFGRRGSNIDASDGSVFRIREANIERLGR